MKHSVTVELTQEELEALDQLCTELIPGVKVSRSALALKWVHDGLRREHRKHLRAQQPKPKKE